ncbi:hypothetical protein [Fluviispira multicolorata]|uniref:Uncharacterized protein n=1 Tax=Fluviispira multicolorata TaxID=2654512 RepID=A0A833JEJ0_9BACT|nr:hypothetical protein [Fluviispira multicolorata]KAB8033231.1 hypothetical protein GCL57_00615 [Fluviispira multicolorata]
MKFKALCIIPPIIFFNNCLATDINFEHLRAEDKRLNYHSYNEQNKKNKDLNELSVKQYCNNHFSSNCKNPAYNKNNFSYNCNDPNYNRNKLIYNCNDLPCDCNNLQDYSLKFNWNDSKSKNNSLSFSGDSLDPFSLGKDISIKNDFGLQFNRIKWSSSSLNEKGLKIEIEALIENSKEDKNKYKFYLKSLDNNLLNGSLILNENDYIIELLQFDEIFYGKLMEDIDSDFYKENIDSKYFEYIKIFLPYVTISNNEKYNLKFKIDFKSKSNEILKLLSVFKEHNNYSKITSFLNNMNSNSYYEISDILNLIDEKYAVNLNKIIDYIVKINFKIYKNSDQEMIISYDEIGAIRVIIL